MSDWNWNPHFYRPERPASEPEIAPPGPWSPVRLMASAMGVVAVLGLSAILLVVHEGDSRIIARKDAEIRSLKLEVEEQRNLFQSTSLNLGQLYLKTKLSKTCTDGHVDTRTLYWETNLAAGVIRPQFITGVFSCGNGQWVSRSVYFGQ